VALNAKRIIPYWPIAVVLAIALFITWAFAATTLVHAGRMGLPLDDSYIYLTYAKQFGRAQPFSYYPGGGYSAGSTSVLWPMLLAPFWTLGARGHALVWVSFGMCSALYTLVALGLYRFVRSVRGCKPAGVLAAVMLLVIAPFAWCALSGMEVAFASAALVGSIVLLIDQSPIGPPRKRLVACLAAASLSRPEAMVLVGVIVGVAVLARLGKRAWRAALWWLVPVVPPIAWLLANRLLAGHFFPNTGVAKSHFFLPGFDWTYWKETVKDLAEKLVAELFYPARGKTSILIWPRTIRYLYYLGAARIAYWAWKQKKPLVGALVIVSPFVMMFLIIATSGLWNFQNYRYIAPALPLLFLPIGVAFAPPDWVPPPLEPYRRWIRRAWVAAAVVLVVLFIRDARKPLVADMRLFAQGAMDTNTQVVAIGNYVHRKLPGARIMFHDAGAIAYYGDSEVYDMLGLVTNHQAEVATNGPGARFEFLESLPPDERPTYFAYYPGWMGNLEFYGDVQMHTFLRPAIDKRRLVGEYDMQIISTVWDHVHTAERPLNDHTGWSVVDRLDIADIASEHAHDWVGRLGRRKFGDPTAKWSVVEKETAQGLLIDGGRTIRAGGERFTIHIDPRKPTRLVIRTGGQPAYPWHDAITRPIQLAIYKDGKKLGELTVAPPAGQFQELTFNIAPQALHTAASEIHVEATGVYRVFHWFVLQPD
jgi:hypothetical protein